LEDVFVRGNIHGEQRLRIDWHRPGIDLVSVTNIEEQGRAQDEAEQECACDNEKSNKDSLG
jgi:hypothetical protein